MKKSDIQMGMKVVPFQKTSESYGGIYKSNMWRQAQLKNQLYLYVTGYNEEEKCWLLDTEPDTDTGDFFKACDFVPLIETI